MIGPHSRSARRDSSICGPRARRYHPETGQSPGSFFELKAGVACSERQRLPGQRDRPADRARAVADLGLCAQQHGAICRRPDEVACCSAAHILCACSGSTRVSPSKTVNNTAGCAFPLHVVVGRVRQQPAELLGVGDGAVLVVPGLPRPNRSYRTMSSSGAEHTAAALRSGRCVTTRRPAARRSNRPRRPAGPLVVHPSGMSFSAAAWKSSNTFCLRSRMPARCHSSPSSLPPRRPAIAYTPPASTQARTFGE